MAVLNKHLNAKLNLQDAGLKTLISFSGVAEDANAEELMVFKNGVSALITKEIANQFLQIETELIKNSPAE